MVKVIVWAALAIAIVVGLVIGCGPRAELAADKVIAKIDKVLGELDVKRKKIEVNLREVRQQALELRDKRIGTEVRLEQLTKKKDSSQSELEKTRSRLGKLKEIAEKAAAEDGYTKNGKTYTAEDIQKSAVELANKFKLAEANVKNLNTSIDALQRSVNFLQNQEKGVKDAMSKLESKIAEIDNKKIAVDAVRHASTVAGEDKSVNDRINKLNEEIDGLFVEVETAMRVEEEKLSEFQSETSSADELLSEPADFNSTIADIDALLGDSNDDE